MTTTSTPGTSDSSHDYDLNTRDIRDALALASYEFAESTGAIRAAEQSLRTARRRNTEAAQILAHLHEAIRDTERRHRPAGACDAGH